MNKNKLHIQYISENDEDKRAALVSREDFPAQLFKGVACDDSPKVKLAMLEHHDPQVEVISKLCDDDDIDVRTKALDKLCNGGTSNEEEFDV
jgi:hypothetical protein